MESFSFYFGLNLGQSFLHTLITFPKPFKRRKLSAIQGKELADLTVETLQSIRNDRDHKLFYKSVEKSAGKISKIPNPLYHKNVRSQGMISFNFSMVILICQVKRTTQKPPTTISSLSTWNVSIPSSVQLNIGLNNLVSNYLVKWKNYF